MIAHVILFQPKASLDGAGRARVFDALRVAHETIPHIRRFAIGRRVKTGHAYDAMSRDFPYFVFFEFESRADLDAYLAHPSHAALGAQFYMASDMAEAYDFDLEEMPGALRRER